jgi:hypothetical protein
VVACWRKNLCTRVNFVTPTNTNENTAASSLYTFGHQTFRIQKVAGLYDLFRDGSKPSLMQKRRSDLASWSSRPGVSCVAFVHLELMFCRKISQNFLQQVGNFNIPGGDAPRNIR